MKEAMLTTTDNPFNPFTHFDQWKNFDEGKGYFTCNYLARIVRTSDELSEADQSLAIDLAIDEIIKFNLLGIYTKIYETDQGEGSVKSDPPPASPPS